MAGSPTYLDIVTIPPRYSLPNFSTIAQGESRIKAASISNVGNCFATVAGIGGLGPPYQCPCSE
jgi:hypothetical protein